MKKFLVVLTILVLVAGFAFADVTGKIAAQYKFDFLGKKTLGYATPNNLAVELTLDSQAGGFTGERYPYVQVEADAIIVTDNSFDNASSTPEDTDYSSNLAWSWGSPSFSARIRVKTFKIVGENWNIDLLKTSLAADYATDAVDSKRFAAYMDDDNYGAYTYVAPSFSYSAPAKNIYGVTVNYDGYKAAIGYNNPDLEAEKKGTLLLGAETKALEFGEGTSAQAAVGFQSAKGVNSFGASAKFGYETEKLAVKVAGDFGFVGAYDTTATPEDAELVLLETQKEVDEIEAVAGVEWTNLLDSGLALPTPDKPGLWIKHTAAVPAKHYDEATNFDVALNVKFAPVTFDFYYGSKADAYGYKHNASSKSAAGKPVEKLLSMKAVVALADVIENVPVTVTATASNILNDSTANLDGKNYSVSVNTTAVQNLDLTVYFKDMLKKALLGKNQQKLGAKAVFTGIENIKLTGEVSYALGGKVLAVAASAEYTAEMFKASVSGALSHTDGADKANLAAVAAISSDVLVEGATLKAELAWDAHELIKLYATKAFTVSCAVQF